MARRGSGCLTALALVLSIAFVALAATLFMLVANGGGPGSPEDEGSPERVAADSFDEYSWQELSDITGLIAAAPSDEEGRAVASQHGIEVGDTRTLTLGDASVVELRVVGIRADERADGGGVAGLTLMTSPIAVRPFSDDKNEGGLGVVRPQVLARGGGGEPPARRARLARRSGAEGHRQRGRALWRLGSCGGAHDDRRRALGPLRL